MKLIKGTLERSMLLRLAGLRGLVLVCAAEEWEDPEAAAADGIRAALAADAAAAAAADASTAAARARAAQREADAEAEAQKRGTSAKRQAFVSERSFSPRPPLPQGKARAGAAAEAAADVAAQGQPMDNSRQASCSDVGYLPLPRPTNSKGTQRWKGATVAADTASEGTAELDRRDTCSSDRGFSPRPPLPLPRAPPSGAAAASVWAQQQRPLSPTPRLDLRDLPARARQPPSRPEWQNAISPATPNSSAAVTQQVPLQPHGTPSSGRGAPAAGPVAQKCESKAGAVTRAVSKQLRGMRDAAVRAASPHRAEWETSESQVRSRLLAPVATMGLSTLLRWYVPCCASVSNSDPKRLMKDSLPVMM